MFRCYFCETRFKCGPILYSHLKLHTGEKPRKCVKSEKEFLHSSTHRDRHEETHTRIEISRSDFSCESKLKKCPLEGDHVRKQMELKCPLIHSHEVVGGSHSQAQQTEGADPRNGKETLKCPRRPKRYTKEQFFNFKTSDKLPKMITPTTCYFCFKTITSLRRISDHINKHTGETPYQCKQPNCMQKFTSYQRLSNHNSRTHPDSKTSQETYQCPQCPKMFETIINFNKHLIKIHQVLQSDAQLLPKKIHQCPSCPKIFKVSNRLQRHLISHSSDRISCPYPDCITTFKTTEHQAKHIKVQHQGKRFLCDLCGKEFTTNVSMMGHRKTVHLQERSFTCKICRKGLTSKTSLKAHISNLHTKENKYHCNLCGDLESSAWFKTSQQLSTHKILHRMKKAVDIVENGWLAKCKICGKGYKHPSSFLSHWRKHRTEKGELIPETKHVCKICKKVFKLRQILEVHIRCHTGERPYACEKCGQTFSQSSHWRMHLRNHAGIDSGIGFKCRYCSIKFNNLYTCQQHQWVAHVKQRRVLSTFTK